MKVGDIVIRRLPERLRDTEYASDPVYKELGIVTRPSWSEESVCVMWASDMRPMSCLIERMASVIDLR
jgi:hypothetical protein